MIRGGLQYRGRIYGKPRASGDDPYLGDILHKGDQ